MQITFIILGMVGLPLKPSSYNRSR